MKAVQVQVKFFRTSSGNEPVREWLKSLPKGARREIGADILSVQWRWRVEQIGLPLVESLGGGMFEVRTVHERIKYRVMFCDHRGFLVLLHGCIKKSRTVPEDIKTAKRRMNELEAQP